MSEPTIDEKIQALRDAGRKVKTDAPAEDVEAMYLELEIELEKAGEPVKTESETAGEPKPEPPKKKQAKKKAAESKTVAKDSRPINERLNDNPNYIALVTDPLNKLGDKAPEVLEWCRDNLSNTDFEEKYGARKI